MNDWKSAWSLLLGIHGDWPALAVAFVAQVALLFLYVVPCGLWIHILDRKFGADFQARIGPSLSGMNGLTQPIADILKLLRKQTAPESNVDRVFLVVFAVALYSTAATLPISQSLLLLDNDLGVFLPFVAIAAVGFLALLYGMYARGVSQLFEGLRQVFRLLAGFLPALIALLAAAVTAGGFRWGQFSAQQGPLLHQWLVFKNPFQLVSFAIFLVSGFIALGIPPFDSRPLLIEIPGAGVHRLQGRSIIVQQFTRYYGMILWSSMSVAIFLGGWNLPGIVSQGLDDQGWLRLRLLLEVAVTTAKTFLVMLVTVWIARVNPRSRIDHISELGWKILSPIAILGLIGVLLWEGGAALYAQF